MIAIFSWFAALVRGERPPVIDVIPSFGWVALTVGVILVLNGVGAGWIVAACGLAVFVLGSLLACLAAVLLPSEDEGKPPAGWWPW